MTEQWTSDGGASLPAMIAAARAGDAGADRSAPDPALVSVCIPTYRRPLLLQEAINSCLAQRHCPIEIVIGDNSDDDETEAVVAQYDHVFPGLLRYKHHRPALDANGNTNDLFTRARGRRLVLLNDDDLLCADALRNLDRCWDECPTLDAAFGKQHVISQDGIVLVRESERLNRDFQRVSEHAGLQSVPAGVGISRMFPNNGFMVRSELARRIGYRTMAEVGPACDFDFGLRLCLEASRIIFVDRYVSCWRRSDDGLSRRSYPACHAYCILSNYVLPDEVEAVRAHALFDLAPAAASGFARLGRAGMALRIMASRHYGPRRWFSPRFLFHLYLVGRSVLSTALPTGKG